MSEDAKGPVNVAETPSEGTQAFDQADAYSDKRLAGTGAVFLLLGIGTVSAAHRRRWREIDVRDRTVDVRKGAGKEAHA